MKDLFEITENIFCEVSEFRGEKRVDIRKWYMDNKDVEMKRTGKGINMSLEEWSDFVAKIGDMEEYVKKNKKK